MEISYLSGRLQNIQTTLVFGRVKSLQGTLILISGLNHIVTIGERLAIQYDAEKEKINNYCLVEVVSFREDCVLALPFGMLDGIGPGLRVRVLNRKPLIYPAETWLGRVVNAFGEPIDDKGFIGKGEERKVRANPPNAHKRRGLGDKIDLGIRALNCFTTCCQGQRMGIFAGSGVGKSILMSMIARYSNADVIVIGLVGERGREVQEFLKKDLGEEGLKRSCVVVATSDEPALTRREAAWTTLAVAEYFRDQGSHVLCLMDSVTRFAMAQREIGLSIGEPPAARGYTPSCFSFLPHLMERAGPGAENQGDITALFTVLVDGDDHNEPVSDAVRGILDGHIVLERSIAHRGRYPAIDVLKSISRALPHCNSESENSLVNYARKIISTYEDMAELIRLGAYRQGSNAEVDIAIKYHHEIENFLEQKPLERTSLEETYQLLANIFASDDSKSQIKSKNS